MYSSTLSVCRQGCEYGEVPCKKILLTLSFVVTFFTVTAICASARVNDTIRVGLRYGSSVMDAANLENAEGSGYEFGFYDDDGEFMSLDWTDETQITMIPGDRGGILVTVTGTGKVLYECEDDTLGVQPQGRNPITWFKGYRYYGGFEYTRSGGGLQVVNVVDLEDYVKGVIPHEMNGELGPWRHFEGPGGLRPDLRLPHHQAQRLWL